MDDTQKIVKCGALTLHSSGSFFKRWHSKYLVLYDGSKSGIKRLELFDSEIKFKKQNPARIIPLIDCIRVVTCQRQKTTYTFEVRTSDQFYLLAAQSFQDMNDWVNCLRLVAFGQSVAGQRASQLLLSRNQQQQQPSAPLDALLEKQQLPADKPAAGDAGPSVPTETHPALTGAGRAANARRPAKPASTASQAAASAAAVWAKSRQRQPSLLGSCKPQPPPDSPFILGPAPAAYAGAGAAGQLDTLTPTVRGQLIAAAAAKLAASQQPQPQPQPQPPQQTAEARPAEVGARGPRQPERAALDEEEENMLYCSIEDNPSHHNYRVKVIETELALRCQLKCYQMSASNTVCQQYEQLAQFRPLAAHAGQCEQQVGAPEAAAAAAVTFYQLIVGPQELTLLNDYAALATRGAASRQLQQQQGLWSWPYQCIRRYGFDKDNCFMFEAGRKCSSGPGQFVVQTPKAYHIYQDVVRFVNELRSLSGGGGGVAQAPAAAAAVTQIPVAWTPLNVIHEEQAGAGSRRQFFSSLQQQQQQQQQQQAPPGEPSTTSTPAFTGAAPAASPASSAGSSPLGPTPERARRSRAQEPQAASSDESGFEQGDEPGAGRRGQCSPAAPPAGRARPSPHSDSSSLGSSCAYSSAGSSPPGQSGGEAPARRQHQQCAERDAPAARCPKSSPPAGYRCAEQAKLAAALLAADDEHQSQEFEDSLIRDVYSEITKMHAKFAVATSSSSADESLSSNSSSADSADSGDASECGQPATSGQSASLLLTSVRQQQQQQQLAGRRAQHIRQEPMYNNIRSRACGQPAAYARAAATRSLVGAGSSISSCSNSGGSSGSSSSSSSSSDDDNGNLSEHNFPLGHTASGQRFPGILNPIPECGEPLSGQLSDPRAPLEQKPRRLAVGQPQSEFRGQPAGSSSPSKLSKFCPPRRDRCPRTLGPLNGTPAATTGTGTGTGTALALANSRSSSSSNLFVPQLPNKHYIINDVQYAKISRNLNASAPFSTAS